MITDYEIKKRSGEEVLYIYLDFDTEFFKLGANGKKKKLDEIVSEFMKKHDISFDGKKVAIISGGLLVATLMLKAPNMQYESHGNFSSVPNVVEVEKTPVDMDIELEDDIQSDVKVEEETKKPVQEVETAPSKDPIKVEVKPDTKPPVSTNKPGTSTPNKVESKPESKPQAPVVDNNIYINVKRSNGSIVKIELEEYVVGVVGAEMPASFNKEALKTQAVIARTYALRANERGQILTDNSSTQNYKSDDQLRAMWGSSYQTYYHKIKSAVQETKGVYLTYNNVIIDAVYHSTSNGRTEASEYVWGNAFPYLVSVESPYDTSNSSFSKEVHISYADISRKLGITVDATSEVQILSKTSGDRIEKISFGGVEFSGVTVRNKLGLRSADFDISKTDTGISFTTRGFGHGVGLSQYGANGMANHGYDWTSILKHYYKGVNLSHL